MSAPDRLSQIQTMWSVVRRAHADDDAEMREAQEALLERYGGAARRYLLGALRDEDAADEVFQEFAVRFVRGDFRRADPEKGRFRSFLKTSLFHLIVDYQKAKRKRPAAWLLEEGMEPAADDERREQDEAFAKSWRDELLSRAWAALERDQQQSGKPLHSVLRLRVENPEMRSPELAAALGEQLGKPIKAGNVRVMLHRARDRFADLLLDEVAQSLDSASPDDIEQELVDLNLLEYCRPALERRE